MMDRQQYLKGEPKDLTLGASSAIFSFKRRSALNAFHEDGNRDHYAKGQFCFEALHKFGNNQISRRDSFDA